MGPPCCSSSALRQRLASSYECSTSYSLVGRSACQPKPAARRWSPMAPVAGGRQLAIASAGAGAAAFSSSPDEGIPKPSIPSAEAGEKEQAPDPAAQPAKTGWAKLVEDLGNLFRTSSDIPQVPWGLNKVFQVMALWTLAYIIIGQVAVPLVLAWLGVERPDLSMRHHAVLHLCLDISQLLITLGILWGTLRAHRPRALGLFPVRWRGWWPLGVLACCLLFPAVDWLAHQSIGWFPMEDDSQWTANLETSLTMGDWVTNIAYFAVVSVCAPVWEEAIFRGFLLTSLLRYLPPPYAVAASSVVFAMCHFRTQTFLPLLVLGGVFSAVFLRTNNLLPPIALHSLWNMYVLLSLVWRPF